MRVAPTRPGLTTSRENPDVGSGSRGSQDIRRAETAAIYDASRDQGRFDITPLRAATATVTLRTRALVVCAPAPSPAIVPLGVHVFEDHSWRTFSNSWAMVRKAKPICA